MSLLFPLVEEIVSHAAVYQRREQEETLLVNKFATILNSYIYSSSPGALPSSLKNHLTKNGQHGR